MFLSRGEFWFGIAIGVAALYFWQRYQAKKAQ